MRSYNKNQFTELIKSNRVKPRLLKDLRFNPDNIDDWSILEILAVSTKSGDEGVLVIQTEDLYVVPYELRKGISDSVTGRSKPITCDFCFTWQQGGKAGQITFRRASDNHTFTYLCCRDLGCSIHVRGLSHESLLSRTNLHEDITVDDRILRLKNRLNAVLKTLGAQPATINDG